MAVLLQHYYNSSVRFGRQLINKLERFEHLGSIVKGNRGIAENVASRIKWDQMKYRKAAEVSLETNRRFYKIFVTPTMMYRSECWTLGERK